MASVFKAIAPAELDQNLQKGFNYQLSRAAELRMAAELNESPRQHLLAAADRAEQSAKELAMDQPVLAAYARGDQIEIRKIEETRPDGVRITSLIPATIGQQLNSHSSTTASFAPVLKNQAIASEAFWETVNNVEAKTVQLPDSLGARIASEAITFMAKAFLGIKFRPGVTEIIDRPDVDVINVKSRATQQILALPIAVHLEQTAAASFHQVSSSKFQTAMDAEIAGIEVLAQVEAAAAERREYFEAATINEARSTATTVSHGEDGTITVSVDVDAMEAYQSALMYMSGY